MGMSGSEIMMWAALAAYVLTGVNLVLAHRERARAQDERAKTQAYGATVTALLKEAFALHDYGARDEAIATLQAAQEVRA